jgi:chromate transporter
MPNSKRQWGHQAEQNELARAIQSVRAGYKWASVRTFDATGMTDVTAKHDEGEPVALSALFIACLKVSLYGIGGGGGLVWARRIAVEQQRWIDERDFADIVSLCQFMPGPNIVGIATCIGTKLRGIAGAGASVAGFLLIPWMIGFAFGVLCLQFATLPVVRHTLSGIACAAAGLLIATGLRMMLPHRTRPAAIFFAAAGCVLMVFAKVSLPIVLLGVAPISIAWAGIQRASLR